MITLEEAKNLKPGQILYHAFQKNADGTPQRWRVNGKPETCERFPERVYVPVKRGLREYDHLTEKDLELVNLQEEVVSMEPKYLNITVKLTDEDRNAFAILGRMFKEMRRAKVSEEEIKRFKEEAMSGDYDHLLQTCMKWVNVE